MRQTGIKYTCDRCGLECFVDYAKIDMYGVSIGDPYAIEFRGVTGIKYGTPLDLVYCPKCGTVKAMEHQTKRKDL